MSIVILLAECFSIPRVNLGSRVVAFEFVLLAPS